MTTSRVTAYESTGDQIVEDAFQHIRVIQKGQSLDADDLATAKRFLNNIVKDFQKDGKHLWKEKEAAVFLEVNRRTYTLGNQENFACSAISIPVESNPVYATQGDWVATTTTAAAASGQPVIDITSLTAYSGTTFNTDCTTYVGVENEDGDLQWTTLLSISTLELTLTDNLTAAVEEGAFVYLYRTPLDSPLKIMQDNVRLWQQENQEIPLYLLSYTDYNLMPDKNANGTVVQISYSPKIDTGELAVWPTSDTVRNVLLFRYQSQLDIFDGSSTQDFPPEWIRTLGWVLASELGHAYGIPIQKQQMIDAKAASLKEQVLSWDMDNTSLFLQPRLWG